MIVQPPPVPDDAPEELELVVPDAEVDEAAETVDTEVEEAEVELAVELDVEVWLVEPEPLALEAPPFPPIRNRPHSRSGLRSQFSDSFLHPFVGRAKLTQSTVITNARMA
jgi:hypothetical protein